jgi:hypothetical protein
LSSRLGKKLNQPVRVGKAIGKGRWVIVSGVMLLVVLFGLQFVSFREQLSLTGFAHTQSILTDRGSFTNVLSGVFAAVDQAGNPVVVSRLKGFGFFGAESDSPRVDKLMFSGSVKMIGDGVEWSTFLLSGTFKVKMDVVSPSGVSKESSVYPLSIMAPEAGMLFKFTGVAGLADFENHLETAAFVMKTGVPYWLGARPERAGVVFTVMVTILASVKDSAYNTLTAERVLTAVLPLRWVHEEGGSMFAIDVTMEFYSYPHTVTTYATPITTTWVSSSPIPPTVSTVITRITYSTMTWTTKTSYTTTLTTSSEPPLDKDKGQMSWLPLFRISIVDIRRVS